jgi:ATP-dependent Clp protease ATP-binding subunit ClpC
MGIKEDDFLISRQEIQTDWFARLTLSESPSEHLARLLGEGVIGQPEACEAVAKRITRAESHLGNPNRPLGVFMFLGPTGVGKTEMARTMAQYLFQDQAQKHYVRVDCSEFDDAASVNRLKGSDPKYVGFGQPTLIMPEQLEGGAVVVFDEIEKAHPDVWRWLLPVMEEGLVKVFLASDEDSTTSVNTKIVKPTDLDFRNSYIVLTSNEGADEMQRARKGGRGKIGFNTAPNTGIDFQEVALNALKNGSFKTFPEFLGRIDEIVGFRELAAVDYEGIFNKFLDTFNNEQVDHNPADPLVLSATPQLRDFILQQASLGSFGARNIRHAIDNTLISKVADHKASKSLPENVLLVGDIQEGEVVFWATSSSYWEAKRREYAEGKVIFERVIAEMDIQLEEEWQKEKN